MSLIAGVFGTGRRLCMAAALLTATVATVVALFGATGAGAATTCATATPYARAISGTASLVGYWRLGDSSSTQACDGRGLNPGTYSAGATLGQPGALAGDSDAAVGFNGTGGNASVPANAALNTGDAFTIEAWAKRGSTGGTVNQTIVSKQGTSWTLAFTPANRLALISGTKTIVTSTNTVADTASWHHVVATKSGTAVALYVDGVNVTGTVSKTTVANSTLPLTIGSAGSGTYFKGALDEVAVYKAALSADQVTNHLLLARASCAASSPYSNAVAGTSGLLGYWRLGERSGTTACDTAGGNPGTYTGGITLGQGGAVPGDTDAAPLLNGTSGWVSIPPLASLSTGDTFSVEGWVKRGSIGGTVIQAIASKQGSAWTLAFDTSNRLVLRSGTSTIAASTTALTDTSGWHYVAATKSGATVRLYLDGANVTGTVTNVTLANSTSPLAIGQTGNGSYFKGQLDEIALYGTALSAAQTANHHALGRAPANTSPPTVSGVARDGEQLTASPGAWTDSQASHQYQWRRCASGGGSCQDVAGATGQTYSLGYADVGATIRVAVTATNAAGSGTASSAPSAVVAALPPANTTPPAIAGTPKQGQTLTADAGSWSGTPGSYSYDWLRCDAGGANCTIVGAGSSPSYTPAASDVGSTVRVAVTSSNSAGSATATSSPTAVVAGLPPTSTSPPMLVGGSTPPMQGEQLMALGGSFEGQVSSRSWKWQRCDEGGGNCTDIGGATGTHYNLVAADVGRTVRAVDVATNAAGSTEAYSAPRGPVLTAAPVNTVPPVLSGTPSEGSQLLAEYGTWTGASASQSFQWQRCSSDGSRCADIQDAVHWFYNATAVDVSHTLRVVETRSNSYGSARAVSARTAVVTGSWPLNAPANTAPPAISGRPAEAHTLTADKGTWTGDSLAYWYQWQACETDGTACADIAGATKPKLVLGSAHVGKTIRVEVSSTNGLGEARATSSVTATVTPPHEPEPTVAPEITGGDTSGDILAVSDGSWDDPVSSYDYQWRRCDASGDGCADIAGATHRGYFVRADDIDSTLRVRVTAHGVGASGNTSTEVTAPIDGVELPARVERHMKSITQGVVRSGAQQVDAACDVVCDQYRRAIGFANSSAAPAAPAVGGQASNLLTGTGAMPASPTAPAPTVDVPTPRPPTVPTKPPPKVPAWGTGLCGGWNIIGCAATAGYAGWKIGTGINGKWLHIGFPPPPPQTDQWADMGDPMVYLHDAGDVSSRWYSYGRARLGPNEWDWNKFLVPLPKTGWYLGGGAGDMHTVYDGHETYCSRPYSVPESPWELVTEPGFNACIYWPDVGPDPWDTRPGGLMDLKAAYAPLRTPEGDPLSDPDDYDGQTAPGTINTPAPPWPGQEEMERRVRAELASGRNPELVDLIDHMLGGPSPDPLEETLEFQQQCGVMLWHYTDFNAAALIVGSSTLRSSAARDGYPSGAYTTTITPVDPRYSQTTLAQHLFGEQRPVEAWVLLCSRQNPSFRPVGIAGADDYWYAPAPAGEFVPIAPAGTGATPMPP
jgi:hypothetical protein